MILNVHIFFVLSIDAIHHIHVRIANVTFSSIYLQNMFCYIYNLYVIICGRESGMPLYKADKVIINISNDCYVSLILYST